MLQKSTRWWMRLMVGLLVQTCYVGLSFAQPRGPEPVEHSRFSFAVRPIFSSAAFDNTQDSISLFDHRLSIQGGTGFSIGATIRKRLPVLSTRTRSGPLFYEAGIFYNQRVQKAVYEALAPTEGSSWVDTSINMRSVAYEIPLRLGIFTRLTKSSFLANSVGVSVDFFQNNIYIPLATPRTGFSGLRRDWIQIAGEIESGYEFRTAKSGIFFIGGQYHRMFGRIGTGYFTFLEPGGSPATVPVTWVGHYFSVVFKYFFPTEHTPEIEYDLL